jgi:hypothetical protein
MRIADTQPLFAWAALEDSPSLETIRRCLEAIPDSPLLRGLREARGRGRDDDSVSPLGRRRAPPTKRHRKRLPVTRFQRDRRIGLPDVEAG